LHNKQKLKAKIWTFEFVKNLGLLNIEPIFQP